MYKDNKLIENYNSVFALKFIVTDRIDVFSKSEYRDIVTETLKYHRETKKLRLYAWCLMSDHIHLVCRVEPPFKITDFVCDFKSFIAKAITDDIENHPGSHKIWILQRFEYASKLDRRSEKYLFWQDSNHLTELQTKDQIQQQLKSIHQNPVKQRIVEKPEDYLYSSARNYAGIRSVIEIDLYQSNGP